MSSTIDYQVGQQNFRGYVAHPSTKNLSTGILVFPDWSGCNDFAKHIAQKLAAMGYVAVVADVYGNGKVAQSKAEKTACMQPLMADRALLRERLQAAYQSLCSLDSVDQTQTAAIGFCFGGLCALDLMRSGANLRKVVSFHGLLIPPTDTKSINSVANVLILHGHDDPMVPPEQVNQFINEMKKANIDWQMHTFSKTQHAFMNPEANEPTAGIVYQPQTAQRAWLAMQQFLRE